MFLQFLSTLDQLNEFFLSYVALIWISLLGAYFTWQTRFFQVRNFPILFKTFFHFLGTSKAQTQGTHPLKAFFASVGGMIGIGNVVAVTTAITIGGPGALLWVWLAGAVGALIKYSEIYLGHKFRVPNSRGGFDGGPMYFLKHAFSWSWIPTFIAILLCIYGTEIYQFSVIVHSMSTNFHLERSWVVGALLVLVMAVSLGGVERVGKICSVLIPIFTLTYLALCFWVIFQNFGQLPPILAQVLRSGFTGHAAIGGFAGASVLMALQHGVARAAYSADIGIGYDSIIQSESSATDPTQQARLSILGVVIDNLVCTCSILVVLVTGVWKSEEAIAGSQLVQTALSGYFPGMDVFIPILLLILGYSTIIAYVCVCIKCARFLSPRFGVPAYLGFAIPAFIAFSYHDQSQAMLVMSVAQSLLLMFNLTGIFKLRNEIEFREPLPFSNTQ